MADQTYINVAILRNICAVNKRITSYNFLMHFSLFIYQCDIFLRYTYDFFFLWYIADIVICHNRGQNIMMISYYCIWISDYLFHFYFCFILQFLQFLWLTRLFHSKLMILFHIELFKSSTEIVFILQYESQQNKTSQCQIFPILCSLCA